MTIPNDVVFVLVGSDADLTLLKQLGVETESGKLAEVPVYDPETFETNVRGIYVAGHFHARSSHQSCDRRAATHSSTDSGRFKPQIKRKSAQLSVQRKSMTRDRATLLPLVCGVSRSGTEKSSGCSSSLCTQD
jgi:hypothetical protein